MIFTSMSGTDSEQNWRTITKNSPDSVKGIKMAYKIANEAWKNTKASLYLVGIKKKDLKVTPDSDGKTSLVEYVLTPGQEIGLFASKADEAP
jgi:hypothetical protein